MDGQHVIKCKHRHRQRCAYARTWPVEQMRPKRKDDDHYLVNMYRHLLAYDTRAAGLFLFLCRQLQGFPFLLLEMQLAVMLNNLAHVSNGTRCGVDGRV